MALFDPLCSGVVVREGAPGGRSCLTLSLQGAAEGSGASGAMARLGGAAVTPATGDPRGQGGPPLTAYTAGGCQWGSELEPPEGEKQSPEPSVPPSLLLPRAQRGTHLPLALPEWL
jgi:hypothetical protein